MIKPTSIIWFFFAISIFSVFFLYLLNDDNEKSSKERQGKLTFSSVVALLVAILLVIFSGLAPFVLTSEVTGFTDKTGVIGDTVGGLMNPFISLSGVIVTGLAFYMQFKANLLQRELFNEQLQKDKERFESEIQINKDQFRRELEAQFQQNELQQFEGQFYEMLRLHKENVNEIEIPAKRTIRSENQTIVESYMITKRNAFVEFKKEFETILREIEHSDLQRIDKKSFEKAYGIFFWGLNNDYDNEEHRSLAELFLDDNTLESRLHKLKFSQFEEESPFETNIKFAIIAFEGHSGFLGHYYRHLFLILKFVVNQRESFLSYERKMRYLKVLRAQLSNHEQIMLFYNWLSGYGKNWENGENHFFTEYCMIHNLWYDTIIENQYIKNYIDELMHQKVKYRKGNMFEIQR